MNGQVEPADAARALSEIARRREQAIRRAAIPRWFWWATAVLTIASVVADMEFQRGALRWAGTALLIAGALAVNGLMLRAVRSTRLRPDLAGPPGSVPRMLAGTAALAAVVTGVALTSVPSLKAAGVPAYGLISSAAAMAVLAAGGQLLTRYHTALLVRRSGGRG
jgi:hypothetical protein